MFTPGAVWSGGLDCYEVVCRLFVPIRLNIDDEGSFCDWLDKQDPRDVKWIRTTNDRH